MVRYGSPNEAVRANEVLEEMKVGTKSNKRAWGSGGGQAKG